MNPPLVVPTLSIPSSFSPSYFSTSACTMDTPWDSRGSFMNEPRPASHVNKRTVAPSFSTEPSCLPRVGSSHSTPGPITALRERRPRLWTAPCARTCIHRVCLLGRWHGTQVPNRAYEPILVGNTLPNAQRCTFRGHLPGPAARFSDMRRVSVRSADQGIHRHFHAPCARAYIPYNTHVCVSRLQARHTSSTFDRQLRTWGVKPRSVRAWRSARS